MLAEFRRGRSALLELISAVVLIALGINLVSGALSEIVDRGLLLALGFSATAIGIAVLVATKRLKPNWELRFRGALAPIDDGLEFVRFKDYELSERVRRFQRAAFAELPALKRLWASESPQQIYKFDKSRPNYASVNLELASVHLMHELLEYVVLDVMSVHISDYFHLSGGDRARLHRYGRKDIPDILLSNRYLELFSRPMEEREGFDVRPGVQVVQQSGAGGVHYSDFKLVLPEGSSVRRTGRGEVRIESPDLVLDLAVGFAAMSHNIPIDFARYYVGMPWNELRCWDVRCRVSARLKTRAYVRRSGWEYYGWLESLAERLQNVFDFPSFLDNIQWPNVAATIRAIERIDAKDGQAALAKPERAEA